MKENSQVYWVFILPSLIIFSFSILIPFMMGLNISFTDWDGISRTYAYNGLENFKKMFTDSSILLPLKNTFIYAVGFTVLNNLMALMLGLILNKWIVGKGFLKVIFFLPMVLSPVLAAFVWSYIFNNILSSMFGISSLLSDPQTVLTGVIIIALWNTIGSNLIIYMAGLDSIPNVYYEASALEGANFWQQFRHVTLPLLVPTFTVCITLTFTTSLREFAHIMAATGGGPAGSSETLPIYIYNNLFSFQEAGYGQAVSLLFMVVLVIIGISLTKFFRNREVEY